MNRKDYRLPLHPKKTIREKQGSHRDLSNCRLDYTRVERAIYASRMARRGELVKELMDAWKRKSCKAEKCSVACKRIKQCLFGVKYWGEDVQPQTATKPRIIFTYRSKDF